MIHFIYLGDIFIIFVDIYTCFLNAINILHFYLTITVYQ